MQIERFNIDSKQNKSSSTVTRCNVQNEKNNLKQVNHTLFHYRRRHGKRLIVQLVHPILQGNPKRKLSEILPKSLIDPPDPFTRNLIACTLLNSIVCFQRWRIELAHTWRTSEREQQNLILLNKTKNPRCIYRRSIQFVELVFVSVVRA